MKPLLNGRGIGSSPHISAAVVIIVILLQNCCEFGRLIPTLASEDHDEHPALPREPCPHWADSVMSPKPGRPSQRASECAGMGPVALPPC